jgi:hypothetical protein
LSPVHAEDALLPTPVDPERLGVVLFEVPGDQLAGLCADLRRLTRQPIQFRWLPDETGRALVRVESPPSLVVWRALEALFPSPPEAGGEGRKARVLAYVEQTPRVWVQLGYRHPRIESLKLPAEHFCLIRPGMDRRVILEAELVAKIESIDVATAQSPLPTGKPPPPIPARLRLIAASSNESPRLWVLREDALSRLTGYCRVTHQQLLTRFTVAVSASAGVPCVVLRATTAKGPPPVFVGQAVAYRPLLKLPNLYVPEGCRLAPPMRRTAICSALALAADRVMWLHPLEGGGFRAESLPDSAFRSLTEWVEYKLADPANTLKPWVQSHRWGFQSFVERAEPKPRPVQVPATFPMRPPPRKKGLLTRTFGWLKKLQLAPPPPVAMQSPEVDPSVPVEEAVKTALGQGDRLYLARPETSSAAVERCQSLEARFLQSLPKLADENPTEQWAELAAAYDATGNHADAALAWLNAIWGQSKVPPLWAWGWLRAEAKAARPEVKAIDPSPWLAAVPGPGTTRAMASWVVWACTQNPPPPALVERAAELQARLEAHEHWLPVRASWLARTAMARINSGDVLGLARTRDRLQGRLLVGGLSPELDTPSFLRFTGEGVRERFQEARRWLVDKRDLIHQWIGRMQEDAPFRPYSGSGTNHLQRVGFEPNAATTRAYVDLVLAWGLARFAEHSVAETIRKQGVASLPTDNPVHVILREAFEFRIQQVREGKPPRGPLSTATLARIAPLGSDERYAVDKLREFSRILEPTVRVTGFGEGITRRADPHINSPVEAIVSLPADRLEEEVGRRLGAELAKDGRPHLVAITDAVLDRAFEFSDASVDQVLDVLPEALAAARDSPRVLARLIEKALAAAALWDRPDLARDLTARFLQLAGGRAGWDVAEGLTGQAFRCLRRLGLKNDADRVLHHVAERVLQGQPMSRLRATRPGDWPAALRVLLHAASGWYYAGRDEQAHAVLDEARKDLFHPETSKETRTTLAIAYTATLAQAPARIALGRLEELFQRLKGIVVGGSTSQYYALKPLILVETAVRAVVSDEFALGPQVRAWLDADEMAVRRRIRDDLKELLAKQGL